MLKQQHFTQLHDMTSRLETSTHLPLLKKLSQFFPLKMMEYWGEILQWRLRAGWEVWKKSRVAPRFQFGLPMIQCALVSFKGEAGCESGCKTKLRWRRVRVDILTMKYLAIAICLKPIRYRLLVVGFVYCICNAIVGKKFYLEEQFVQQQAHYFYLLLLPIIQNFHF